MSAFLPVISTRFPTGKPWSTRKRQTGTGVFCLLFVGRLNSKNFQHLTQINNAHICHDWLGHSVVFIFYLV